MERKDEQQIRRSLKRFINKEGRVGFQLRQLNELFRMGVKIENFSHIFEHSHSVLAVFKIFILLHRLILQGSQSSEHLTKILGILHYSHKGQFQQFLTHKLMEPYRLYLQKRILIPYTGLQFIKKEEKSMRVFQLLNLINLVSSFSDIIYTFGRYYMDKFTCVVDFNIILGADLNNLYSQMVDYIERPANREILQEIEIVHQKMYIVFYNCYFHRYLKNYIPKWVLTDLIGIKRFSTPHKYTSHSTINHSAKDKYRSFSSAKTKSTTPAKSKYISSDLADSCLFLNEKVEEEVENGQQNSEIEVENDFQDLADNKQMPQEHIMKKGQLQQRFKLLLSMERVVKKV